jgi:hypothetical protein
MDSVDLHDAKVSGANLTIGHKDQVHSSSISKSQVASSTVELIGNGDRQLLVSQSSFDACEVVGTRAFRYFLHSASWTGCRFLGQFTDCVFGHDPMGRQVIVRECDFSEADLHIVVFRGGLDYESCGFGSWPTVVFARHQLDIPGLKRLGLPPCMLGMVSCGRTRNEEWLVLDVSKYDPIGFDIYCVLHSQPGVHFHNAPFTAEPTREETAAASSKYLEQIRRYELYRFWNWITQSVSLTSVDLAEGEAVVTFKSGNSPHIPLPGTFRARLHGLKRADMGGAGFLADKDNKKTFRLMGASIASDLDSVSLKGHRKALGTVCFSYQSISIERCDGTDAPIESLSEWMTEPET